MKLNKLVLTLTAAALLPTFAYAGTDAVADSFDRSFVNESFINASSAGTNQIAASFERAFGDETIVAAYGAKSDLVLASFKSDLSHDPVPAATTFARADSLDRINSSLNLGDSAVVASFERDLLGNAAIAAQDPVLASFEHDLYREPVVVAAAVVQGGDAFIINEPDTILANFYRELHWMPGTSAVYVR